VFLRLSIACTIVLFALVLLTSSGCTSVSNSVVSLHAIEAANNAAPQSLGKWSFKSSMPTTRRDVTAGIINGIFYGIGGIIGEVSNTAYDPTTDSWSIKTPMPSPRTTMAVGVIKGTLYAVGGCCDANGFGLNTVEAYVPGGSLTNTWTTKAAMPTARFGLAGGVVNGTLYAVGGAYNVNGGGPLNSVEAYDPASNTWSTKAAMPTARVGLAVGVINGILYAVGGCDNKTTNPHNYNTLEAYNPVTDTWTTKAPMPTARQYPGAGVINGRLFVVGGYNVYELNTVEAYDPATDTWTTKASMLKARDGMGVGVIGRTLYAAGGWNGGPLNTNEAFKP
jgi:N-acetylneuraminic acid mutarotase